MADKNPEKVPPRPRDCTKIKRWLSTKKFRDVIDHRELQRGALWVIARSNPPTEDERSFFEKQTRDKGYDFRWAPKGSKATKGKPAWYWEPREPRNS